MKRLFYMTALLPALAFGQAPGGFVEDPLQATARGQLSQAEINAFLPQGKGPLTYPAPYNTRGARITEPADCGGGACVLHHGYSYWSRMNAHSGLPEITILVGLERTRGGPGPSLYKVNKATLDVTGPVPLFTPDRGWSWSEAETWYWSATDPNMLYAPDGAELARIDATTSQGSVVVNVADKLNGNYNLRQAHTSADDTVHSFTLREGGQTRGCAVYLEATDELLRFDQGSLDECQIDQSGDWLVIKANVNGSQGTDNRIVHIPTRQEYFLDDRQGAPGHSDLGHGVLVGNDNWADYAGTVLAWDYQAGMPSQLQRGDSLEVYRGTNWNSTVIDHHSFRHHDPSKPLAQQFACGSTMDNNVAPHSNEVVCYLLDGSRDTLVVAPVMGRGAESYERTPKGSVDVTGQYFLWSSNAAGNRLDFYLAEIPGHLLTGEVTDPVDPVDPPPPPPDCPDCPVCPTCPDPIVCPAPSPFENLTRRELNIMYRELNNYRNQTRNNWTRHDRDAVELDKIMQTIDEARQ